MTTAFVNSFEIVGINSVVVDYVIQIRKTSKITLPDAIILATSKSLTADLITSNLKDFIGVESGVHLLSPTEV